VSAQTTELACELTETRADLENRRTTVGRDHPELEGPITLLDLIGRILGRSSGRLGERADTGLVNHTASSADTRNTPRGVLISCPGC
jgi:hypothetical protein